MLIEKSSQTAGPATREKKKSDTFHLSKVYTNRKHQDCMQGGRKR